MDSAADGLLALSNTAAALVDSTNENREDDDRSSSLSELEDAPEIQDLEVESVAAAAQPEADSEAETERLEESPDKFKRKPFGISPSKLAQSIVVDERPEIEALTDSGASSPMSLLEDSDADESDEDADKRGKPMQLLDQPLNNKRKRLSDVLEAEDQSRIRRRRTGSIESGDEKDGIDSDNDEERRISREATVEPLPERISRAPSQRRDEEDDEQAQARQDDQRGSSDEGKSKKSALPSRSSRRKARETIEPDSNGIDENNDPEESDEEIDAEDADAQVKSAEEQAKRVAAMEALSALEQRFATLRDRLYDERIAQINHELAQLAEPEPSHPELLRQLECVKRYRDEKFEVEQNLLVYKVAALKRKSIAERSQIHSAYFQTIRDIREKHVEKISEQFYRIQQHRFKSNVPMPVYTIPFPERRSQQIIQQTAYNKEVSVLSGVAKYVGFPAAPELPSSHSKELEEDMEKMGITMNSIRSNTLQRVTNTSDNTISAKVAGEQFLEQTPWANPQHPMNRLGLNRQGANNSPFNETYSTPAHQQKTIDSAQMIGSASTIPEHPSQPASSAVNTPLDGQSSQTKIVSQAKGLLGNYRVSSTSPSEIRRGIPTSFANPARPASQPRDMPSNQASSPLVARANLINSPKRTSSVQPEKALRNDTASPFKQFKESITTVGNSAGRFGPR